MAFRSLVLLALSLCACARTIRAGEGQTNAAAIVKIRALADEGRREAMQTALATADARPDDLRAQRKAAELVLDQLETLRESQQVAALYAKAQPMLARLEDGPESCTTRVEAGRVRTAAEDREAAVLDFATSARLCQSLPAFIQAGYALRAMGRCQEVFTLAPLVFTATESKDWIAVFDVVASCSTALSLRGNLSFAPEQSVNDYFQLLQQREVQRRESAERAEKESQARAAAEENHGNCTAACDKTAGLCESTCGLSNPMCLRRCRAAAMTCKAGCI
jgi:hypothetical protein